MPSMIIIIIIIIIIEIIIVTYNNNNNNNNNFIYIALVSSALGDMGERGILRNAAVHISFGPILCNFNTLQHHIYLIRLAF